LQKEDPKLTGFCVVSRSQKSLAAKEKGSFACLEDAVVEVVIHQCEDKNNQVHLTVKAPVQGLVVYKANCGKFFPMVTGYEAKEQIPPAWASMAVGHAASPGWMGMVQSMATLTEGRCRPRLVIAICVEPCSGK
jgi:hypothetical protein